MNTMMPSPARPDPSSGPGLAPNGPSASPAPGSGAVLRSDLLLAGRKAVDIEHNGAVYRLQATRLGKLILTK